MNFFASSTEDGQMFPGPATKSAKSTSSWAGFKYSNPRISSKSESSLTFQSERPSSSQMAVQPRVKFGTSV